MGGCVSQNRGINMYEYGQKVFYLINTSKNNKMTSQDIENYFSEFGKSASKILMRQIDTNMDGIISKSQWIGYWQYIKKAGYSQTEIIAQMKKIKKRKVQLDFPKAKQLERTQARSTAVHKIIQDLKNSPQIPINIKTQQ